MSTDWARPTDGNRPPPAPTGEVIEITLDGPDDRPTNQPDDLALRRPDQVPHETNIRKLVGIASIVGVVIGVVGAVVVTVGDDGEPVDPPTTTLPPEEASAVITTPPTLPPVGAVDEGFAGEAGSEADPTAPTIPVYPAAPTGGTLPQGDTLDLPAPPLDRPVVATITISRPGETLRGTASYDPVTDRVRLELGDGSVSQLLLIDRSTEEVLLSVSLPDAPRPGEMRWQRLPENAFGPPNEIAFRDYVDAIVLGPVRGDTVGRAMRAPVGSVMLDETTIAHQWIVAMTVGEVPEWEWMYGGRGDEPQDPLEFEVYVADDGATYVTQGVNATGGDEIATVHRVRLGDGLAGPIDWPSDDLIDEFPAFDDTPDQLDLDDLRPTYETDPLADPADFELDTALEALRTATPPVITVWERGPRGVAETVVRRDDTNDRLALTRRVVETVDGTEPFASYFAQIDDQATGTGWLRRGEDDPWVSAPHGSGITPIDPRWEVGLVTADELAAAQRTGTGATPVVLENGVVVKPFTLVLPAGTIQWEEPLVGGVSSTDPIDATVFVGADGLVHEIQVVANQGLPRLFQQRFDHSSPTVTVELP